MADQQSTTSRTPANPARTALTRQLARADELLRQDPGDQMLVEIRDRLAAALEAEGTTGLAKATAALARQALNATEALRRAGGR
jgi:hypothetical protein